MTFANGKLRLMVMGYGRHGKDTVCEILRDTYGFTFESSSHFVAERAVRPHLAARGITYVTFEDMYADRGNHRSEWFDAIASYNSADPSRLGRELYTEFDVYCGIRNVAEFQALIDAGGVEFSIWVDASERHPPEPSSSITVTPHMADFVIDNNGPIDDLPRNVAAAMSAALATQRSMRIAA